MIVAVAVIASRHRGLLNLDTVETPVPVEGPVDEPVGVVPVGGPVGVSLGGPALGPVGGGRDAAEATTVLGATTSPGVPTLAGGGRLIDGEENSVRTELD
jgi:hypothetical protein